MATIIEVFDSDGSYQWMLRLVGRGLMNILLYSWKTLYKILINYKGVNVEKSGREKSDQEIKVNITNYGKV